MQPSSTLEIYRIDREEIEELTAAHVRKLRRKYKAAEITTMMLPSNDGNVVVEVTVKSNQPTLPFEE